MNYKITYDTSSERNSAERRYVVIAESKLAKMIEAFIRNGRIIYSISQA